MEQVKIDGIKTILKFVLGLQKAFENSLADGKFEPSDLLCFKDSLFAAPAVAAALPYLKGGLGQFSQNDLEEIKGYAIKEFDLKNDKLEEIIEDSIGIAVSIFGLVKKVKA